MYKICIDEVYFFQRKLDELNHGYNLCSFSFVPNLGGLQSIASPNSIFNLILYPDNFPDINNIYYLVTPLEESVLSSVEIINRCRVSGVKLLRNSSAGSTLGEIEYNDIVILKQYYNSVKSGQNMNFDVLNWTDKEWVRHCLIFWLSNFNVEPFFTAYKHEEFTSSDILSAEIILISSLQQLKFYQDQRVILP